MAAIDIAVGACVSFDQDRCLVSNTLQSQLGVGLDPLLSSLAFQYFRGTPRTWPPFLNPELLDVSTFGTGARLGLRVRQHINKIRDIRVKNVSIAHSDQKFDTLSISGLPAI